MNFPTVPPGEGGSRARTHWTHVKTPEGTKGQWHAHCAGPCYWCRAHTKSRSQVCLTWFTGAELPCPRCNPLDPVEVIGYQPLYREVDGKPVFVIVHEPIRERIDALKFHSRVLVGRNEGKSEGVWVAPALNPNPKYETTLAERKRYADLSCSLLAVWRYPELREWVAKKELQAPTSDNGLSLLNPEEFGPMHRAAARLANEAATADNPNEVFVRSVKAAQRNGKHTKRE